MGPGAPQQGGEGGELGAGGEAAAAARGRTPVRLAFEGVDENRRQLRVAQADRTFAAEERRDEQQAPAAETDIAVRTGIRHLEDVLLQPDGRVDAPQQLAHPELLAHPQPQRGLRPDALPDVRPVGRESRRVVVVQPVPQKPERLGLGSGETPYVGSRRPCGVEPAEFARDAAGWCRQHPFQALFEALGPGRGEEVRRVADRRRQREEDADGHRVQLPGHFRPPVPELR